MITWTLTIFILGMPLNVPDYSSKEKCEAARTEYSKPSESQHYPSICLPAKGE
jgi:hypothetical protein